MNIRQDPRMAGCVLRWHTWPHLREQTVADHTWQTMRMLLAIWPLAPQEMLVYVLGHDAGEIATGDMPYPVKKNNPALKREADRIEKEARLAMCIPWGFPPSRPIPEPWMVIFKLAEFMEMWEDGHHELMLGNRFAAPVVTRCWTEIAVRLESLEESEPLIVERAKMYTERRRVEWGIAE